MPSKWRWLGRRKPRAANAATSNLQVENLADHTSAGVSTGTRRDLWEEAYDKLRKASPHLVAHFEGSIGQMGLDNLQLAPIGSFARQEQLSLVIGRRLETTERQRIRFTVADREIVLQEQMNKTGRIVTLAKNFISSSGVCVEPHAALAWAGVCMLLPVSTIATLILGYVVGGTP